MAQIVWTDADVAAVKAALLTLMTSPEAEVQFSDGRRVRYREPKPLLDLLSTMETTSTPASRTSYAQHSRG